MTLPVLLPSRLSAVQGAGDSVHAGEISSPDGVVFPRVPLTAGPFRPSKHAGFIGIPAKSLARNPSNPSAKVGTDPPDGKNGKQPFHLHNSSINLWLSNGTAAMCSRSFQKPLQGGQCATADRKHDAGSRGAKQRPQPRRNVPPNTYRPIPTGYRDTSFFS